MQKAEHDRFTTHHIRVCHGSVEAHNFILLNDKALHLNQNILLRNVFDVD